MSVFAYYDTDTQSVVYHVVPSPGTALSTISSETESEASALTIETEDLPGFFVLHHGRQQPSSDNIAKWYPPDNVRRGVMLYLIAKSGFGDDYLDPVAEAIAPLNERQRHVLEIGTKTGVRVQAMATRFPHVQFCTLDIVPMVPHVPRPNIAFEVYDFSEGLMLEDESQDAVFLNVITELVKDYRSLLREVYRVLRPGGLIHIQDYSQLLWDPTIMARITQDRNPHMYRMSSTILPYVSSLGIDPETIEKIPQWLVHGSDLWRDGQQGFKDIQSDLRMHPAYPHEGFACMELIDAKVAPCIRNLTELTIRDECGVLQDAGLGEEEAVKLIDDVIEELKQHDKCVLFKMYRVCATKQ